MKNKITGFALVSFLAATVGVVISFLLLKEDVISTANTLFEYFPKTFGVKPSSTWEGAIVLGLFTSVLQIVSASILLSKDFSRTNRWLSLFTFISSCMFDNYTDIVFRSGNLTGNIQVAIISTLAFYTLGSELLQWLSWLIFMKMWRPAISDAMWGIARLGAGLSSIGAEWSKFKNAAKRKELSDRGGGGEPTPSNPYKPSQTQNRPFSNKPTTSPFSNKPTSSPFKSVAQKPPTVSGQSYKTPSYHPVSRQEEGDLESFLTKQASSKQQRLDDN